MAKDHPYFASVATALTGATVGTLPARETFEEAWNGARTTIQRWFADPVVNTEGVHRGLGIIFTHDHYGPSTHQQIGLYSTVLTEPAGSQWVHNETGTGLGCTTAVNPNKPAGTVVPNTVPCRWDGGPTSWQAAILPQPGQPAGASALEPFREFYFEYSDFQHAYAKNPLSSSIFSSSIMNAPLSFVSVNIILFLPLELELQIYLPIL